MKKASLLGTLCITLLLLGACNSNKTEVSTQSSGSKSEVTVVSSSDTQSEETHSSIFKDGKFSSNAFSISIDETRMLWDSMIQEDVLFIKFTIENNTQNNIVPQEEFKNLFTLKQKDDTSEYDLESAFVSQNASDLLYPTENRDGSLIEDEALRESNEQKAKEFEEQFGKKLQTELLPGKSVQTAIMYPLESDSEPITVSLDENLPMKEKEDFVINLK